jgi:hypothetical protein
MTDPEVTVDRPRGVSPFLAFGLVAAAAASGAVFELSYYSYTPALAPGALGTTVGIVLALIAFFALGLRAPKNE